MRPPAAGGGEDGTAGPATAEALPSKTDRRTPHQQVLGAELPKTAKGAAAEGAAAAAPVVTPLGRGVQAAAVIPPQHGGPSRELILQHRQKAEGHRVIEATGWEAAAAPSDAGVVWARRDPGPSHVPVVAALTTPCKSPCV